MILIIEGPEKSGKTTLVAALIKKFPGVMIKITDRPKDFSREEKLKIKFHYLRVMQFAKDSPENTFILDRFYPSEMVYSIKRGYDAMKDSFFRDLETHIMKEKHLLVFCNPGKEIISKRLKETPDDYLTKKENIEMLQRYQNFLKKTRLFSLEVNTSNPTEITVEKIIKKLKEYPEWKLKLPSSPRAQLTLFPE